MFSGSNQLVGDEAREGESRAEAGCEARLLHSVTVIALEGVWSDPVISA